MSLKLENENKISNIPYKVESIISDIIFEESHIRNEYGEDPSVDNSDEVADIIIDKLKFYGYEIKGISNGKKKEK